MTNEISNDTAPWTDADVDILVTSWRAGVYVKFIAQKLGRSYRAVIGKRDRLRKSGVLLADRSTVPNHTRGVRKKSGPKPKQKSKPWNKSNAPRPKPVFDGLLKVDGDPGPVEPAVTTEDLDTHHCRWPYDSDNGETIYCGRSKEDVRYCAFHAEASRPKKQAA
jgi:hypothetical protein